MDSKIKFAPREIFEQMLEYMVIPTFDLVIEYGDQGVIIVRRKIEPYKDVWALPGLRMYKGEDIEDTLVRIAQNEVGLTIDPANKVFLGQFVGKFTSEHERQDISTGYLVRVSNTQSIKINQDHFYSYRLALDIADNMGAMYKFYLRQYFQRFADTNRYS